MLRKLTDTLGQSCQTFSSFGEIILNFNEGHFDDKPDEPSRTTQQTADKHHSTISHCKGTCNAQERETAYEVQGKKGREKVHRGK